MTSRREQTQSPGLSGNDDDELVTWERYITDIKHKSEERRRQRRADLKTAYETSLAELETALVSDLAAARDALHQDHAARETRIAAIMVEKQRLAAEIDEIVKGLQRGMDELRTAQQRGFEILTAHPSPVNKMKESHAERSS